MPSAGVGGNLAFITSSACKVTYKSRACGHTQGGVTVTIKHKLRERKVDEHGDTTAETVHVGDDVMAQTRFVEKTIETIQTVYLFGGQISTSMWGLGKTPGTKGSTNGGTLLLHPLDGTSTKDDITIYKAVVFDQGAVQFGDVQQDRVFDCTFKGLIDESQTTYLLAKFGSSLAQS